MSKYLTFSDWRVGGTLAGALGVPRVITVKTRRHGELLGAIHWYPHWQCHVVRSFSAAVWSSGCLADVAAKLEALDREQGTEAENGIG
jgi:hypothetical protein